MVGVLVIVVVVSVDGWMNGRTDGRMCGWVGLRRRGSDYSNWSKVPVRRTIPCELKAVHELSLA